MSLVIQYFHQGQDRRKCRKVARAYAEIEDEKVKVIEIVVLQISIWL